MIKNFKYFICFGFLFVSPSSFAYLNNFPCSPKTYKHKLDKYSDTRNESRLLSLKATLGICHIIHGHRQEGLSLLNSIQDQHATVPFFKGSYIVSNQQLDGSIYYEHIDSAIKEYKKTLDIIARDSSYPGSYSETENNWEMEMKSLSAIPYLYLYRYIASIFGEINEKVYNSPTFQEDKSAFSDFYKEYRDTEYNLQQMINYADQCLNFYPKGFQFNTGHFKQICQVLKNLALTYKMPTNNGISMEQKRKELLSSCTDFSKPTENCNKYNEHIDLIISYLDETEKQIGGLADEINSN